MSISHVPMSLSSSSLVPTTIPKMVGKSPLALRSIVYLQPAAASALVSPQTSTGLRTSISAANGFPVIVVSPSKDGSGAARNRRTAPQCLGSEPFSRREQIEYGVEADLLDDALQRMTSVRDHGRRQWNRRRHDRHDRNRGSRHRWRAGENQRTLAPPD